MLKTKNLLDLLPTSKHLSIASTRLHGNNKKQHSVIECDWIAWGYPRYNYADEGQFEIEWAQAIWICKELRKGNPVNEIEPL